MIMIMNHSVGLNDYIWYAAHISETAAEFDIQCSAYQKSGKQTVFMEEVWRRKNDNNILSLNFDDGYLDNWIHIMPILQYHNLRGTVFMSSDFIDPRDIIRPQISRDESVNAINHKANDCCAGFLSYPEMRAMEDSGVMEIQAHAKTHTWYISGPEIIDFWHPHSAVIKDGPVWMIWNKFPDQKPFYLTKGLELEKRIPYGTAVLKNGKALETKRFFPDKNALQDLNFQLTEYVNNHGVEEYFKELDWQKPLFEIAHTFSPIPGKYESTDEYYSRVESELIDVKEKLEYNLHKKIHGICWPGGGLTTKVVDIAKRLGYTCFTMPSRWKKGNAPDGYGDLLQRVGTPRYVTVKGKNLRQMSEKDVLHFLKSCDGTWIQRTFLWRFKQILALMGR